MEIGAHTATHPVLSMIGIEEQKAEIEISKRRLEHVTGGPITSFAYPFGSLSDYQAQTIRAVAEMGFDCACSTFADVVTDAADRFQLPRFTIRDWSGAQLRERLDAWTRVS